MRAPDGWESLRFQAGFWLQAGSGKVVLSRPAHQRVTQAVRRFFSKERKALTPKMSEIKSKINELAKVIGASKNALPTFGFSEHSGRPHVEADSNGYHFVIAERGQEFHRHTSFDMNEILYDVFQAVTFELACKYELDHRVQGQDFRRILFEQQEELLSRLSPSWGERRRREHDQFLLVNPYNDALNPVAAYAQELKEKGFPPEVRWEMARDKFSPPKES